MNHIYLIRFVVLKRPGFQSQKYGMPNHTLPFITKQWVAVRLRLPPDDTRNYGIIDTKQPACQFDLFEAKY